LVDFAIVEKTPMNLENLTKGVPRVEETAGIRNSAHVHVHRQPSVVTAILDLAGYPAAADPPQNLGNPGYPTPTDIKQAYSLFRLYLRIATEDSVKEPELPNIAADVWKAVQKIR
jgi:hypothetical protein